MHDKKRYVETFSPSLNEALGGGIGTTLITHIHALDGYIRSVFATQLAHFMLRSGKRVLFGSTGGRLDLINAFGLLDGDAQTGYFTLKSLNDFEEFATYVDRADFIVVDGTGLKYAPAQAVSLVRSHSKTTPRTFDQIRLAALAKIVRAVIKHDRRLVLCSSEAPLTGIAVHQPKVPSSDLQLIQGHKSNCIELVPSDYALDEAVRFFYQEVVVHRVGSLAPHSRTSLNLVFSRNPVGFFEEE